MGAKIRLSTPLWPRASAQDRRETVIHEACHCIVGFKHGRVAAHGAEWKQAMRNCGVEPLRTHSVDRTGLARRQRQFTLLIAHTRAWREVSINPREYKSCAEGTEIVVPGVWPAPQSGVGHRRGWVVQKSTGFLAAHRAITDVRPR